MSSALKPLRFASAALRPVVPVPRRSRVFRARNGSRRIFPRNWSLYATCTGLAAELWAEFTAYSSISRYFSEPAGWSRRGRAVSCCCTVFVASAATECRRISGGAIPTVDISRDFWRRAPPKLAVRAHSSPRNGAAGFCCGEC